MPRLTHTNFRVLITTAAEYSHESDDEPDDES